MLVLTRKLGETIRIGNDITVIVLEVRAGQVKFGVQAPDEVEVHRGEVYDRIQQEHRTGTAGTHLPNRRKSRRNRRR